MGPVGLGRLALTVSQLRTGGVEPNARLGQHSQQLPLSDGDLFGLGFQLLGFSGVGVAGRRRLEVEMLSAFVGNAHRGGDSFGKGGQPEPGVLDRLGPDRELGQCGLVRSQLFRCDRQPPGGLVVLPAHGGLGLEDRVPLHLPVH